MRNIKCSNCGLPNFVSAETCKRCLARLEWQPEPIPETLQLHTAVEYKGWFNVPMKFLLVVFGLELLLFGLSQTHLLGDQIPSALAAVFLFGGIALLIVSHFWLLARIYQESPGFALASFFMPIVSFIAVAKFPDRTKRAFVGRFICFGIVLCSLMMLPYDRSPNHSFTDPKRQVRFDYPSNWSVEENQKFGTLVVASPDYGSQWKAAVAISAFTDKEWSSAAEQRLAEYQEDLRKAKRDFVLKSTRAVTHPSNLDGAEFVYTCVDAQSGITVMKRTFLLWHRDGRVFEVNETAYVNEWQRFEPALNKIADSFRPTY
jgi:hypothetical protein